MSRPLSDPYAVLGVTAQVSDGELRRVYRTLVKLHHPDHNGGSPESAARFAQIQDAYARVAQSRRGAGTAGQAVRSGYEDPAIEKRIADLERELAARQAAAGQAAATQAAATQAAERQAHAARPTREAAGGPGQPPRPTPEELGHYETDDSLTSIIEDAAAELGERLKDTRRSELSRRLSDLLRGTRDGD